VKKELFIQVYNKYNFLKRFIYNNTIHKYSYSYFLILYAACRHGTKTGILESFESHHAPITGINPHNVPGPVDFSHLFLTSSFDWSVKLWSLKVILL
jgi:hypothetical protein